MDSQYHRPMAFNQASHDSIKSINHTIKAPILITHLKKNVEIPITKKIVYVIGEKPKLLKENPDENRS